MAVRFVDLMGGVRGSERSPLHTGLTQELSTISCLVYDNCLLPGSLPPICLPIHPLNQVFLKPLD